MLERFGMRGLEIARGLTHSDMHAQRRRILFAFLSKRRARTAADDSAQQLAAAR
jgi:hypothetical protein